MKSLVLIVALIIPAQLLVANAASDASPLSVGTGSNPPVLKVAGNLLVADGRPVRLRGINWGWWHLCGTRYSEADMQHLAQWGANTVRLAFSYNDLETDDNPAVFKEDGFKDVDDVAQWAKRYGIYVILDMHVTPGGQSPQPYCAGGRNSLWTDASEQSRFVALWSEIARRYRNRPEIAAYELLNEPGSNQKTPDLLRSIDQRAITAIRAVDPDKIIVVGGDYGSGPDQLAGVKFADNNILYTFHWYEGSGGNEDFISSEKEEPGISGTYDWVKMEKTFNAPVGCDHMSVVLRSNYGDGSAWFDDVQVTDASGKVLQSAGFDRDTQGYHPEAFPEAMSFDPLVGHDKPGSLKEQGKIGGWAGWVSERLPVQPGQSYHISAWMKLDQATGDNYLLAEFFRSNTVLDPVAFKEKIIPAIEFAKKYNVPVWVGEFGCDTSNPDLQGPWVNACISLFEQNGFSWTYWSDRSTAPPAGMDLQPEHADASDYPVNEKLLAPLRAGWALNQRP